MLPVLLDLKDHVETSCSFSFEFFFFKIAIKEKGKISPIPMMTIMTMISSYDRPRSHSGLFCQRNIQSQCTVYLPVHLTPFQKYPGSLQIHKKDPLVLWHMELPLQLCFPVAHSFTSEKQEAWLLDTIQFAFFLNSLNSHSDDYRRNWFQSESYF